MSTVSPWGLGINRAEIESLVIELTMIATGLPANRVLIVDQGASTPDPPRPFVGIFVSSPVVPMKTGGDIRLFPAYEAWTVTVTDASDGVYSISIQGTPYAFTAASNTIEEVRDGLLAAFGTPSAFTATAQGVDSIDILSTVKGARLLPETSPLTLLLVNTRGPADQWKFEPAELQVNISCNALPSLEAPSAAQNAQTMADQVRITFDSRLMTEKMRDCGHVPVRISTLDSPGLLVREMQSQAIVQIALRTTMRYLINLPTVVEIPTDPHVLQ